MPTKRTVDDILSLAVQAAREDRLLLFVGTGFSRAVLKWRNTPRWPVPSWLDLIRNVMTYPPFQRLNPANYFDANQSRLRYDCPAISSAIVYDARRGRQSARTIHTSLQRTIAEQTCWIPTQAQCDEIGGILADLNPVAIVTTNYDEILEALLDDRCGLFERHDESRLPLRNKIGVWHVHGSIRHPEDIVITTEDYLEFFRPGSYEQTKLAQLLHDYTTVFVGYSMSDINLLTALDWAQNVYRTTNGPSKHGRIDESDSNVPRQIIVEYDSRKEIPEIARIERPATALIQCSNVIRFLAQIAQTVHEGTTHEARKRRGNSRDPNGRKRRAVSEETKTRVKKLLSDKHAQAEMEKASTVFEKGDNSTKRGIIESLKEVWNRLGHSVVESNHSRMLEAGQIAPGWFLCLLFWFFPIRTTPVAFRIWLLESISGFLKSDRPTEKNNCSCCRAIRPSPDSSPAMLSVNLEWLEKTARYAGFRETEAFARAVLHAAASSAEK